MCPRLNTIQYRCQYLGGFARNLDVSEVINTNLQGEDGVADIAGRGLSASDGKISFKNNDLYGLIMCIYHAKPIVEWDSTNILHPCLTKVKATDYAIPEFDSIGMQPLLRLNIMYRGNSPLVQGDQQEQEHKNHKEQNQTNDEEYPVDKNDQNEQIQDQ